MTSQVELVEALIERIKQLPQAKQEELLALLDSRLPGRQRRYLRYAKQVEVGIGTEDKAFLAQSKDISAGGMFVEAPQPLDPHKTLSVVLSLPSAEQPFKFKGHIVRLTSEGIAVEFDQVTPYIAQMLEAAIKDA